MSYNPQYPKKYKSSDDYWGLAVGVIVIFAIIIAVIIVRSNFESDCIAHGGHSKNVDRAQICVSSDGRLIEW